MNADDMLKDVRSELDQYVIDENLQHTDDFIFCVTHFAVVRHYNYSRMKYTGIKKMAS
jgi:hypothetical protein